MVSYGFRIKSGMTVFRVELIVINVKIGGLETALIAHMRNQPLSIQTTGPEGRVTHPSGLRTSYPPAALASSHAIDSAASADAKALRAGSVGMPDPLSKRSCRPAFIRTRVACAAFFRNSWMLG